MPARSPRRRRASSATPTRWRRSGVNTEPTPRPPTAAASTTPNTRPATRSGRVPLDQRHRGDVDDTVPDPEQAERDHGGPRPWQGGERDQRSAEAGESEPEVGSCAPAPNEREREQRADDGADARRRLQEPDAGVAEPEELERDHDDEHAVGPRHERLRTVEADHDAQTRLAPGRPGSPPRTHPPPRAHAPASVAARPSGCARRTRRSRGTWRRRDAECERGAAHGVEQSSGSRAGEGSDAVEGARGDVRGGQLLGGLREARDQRRLGGAEGSARRWRSGRRARRRLRGRPPPRTAAIAARVETRKMSTASITRRCSWRSAKPAMNGAEIAAAPIRANMTRPTAVAPPW